MSGPPPSPIRATLLFTLAAALCSCGAEPEPTPDNSTSQPSGPKLIVEIDKLDLTSGDCTIAGPLSYEITPTPDSELMPIYRLRVSENTFTRVEANYGQLAGQIDADGFAGALVQLAAPLGTRSGTFTFEDNLVPLQSDPGEEHIAYVQLTIWPEAGQAGQVQFASKSHKITMTSGSFTLEQLDDSNPTMIAKLSGSATCSTTPTGAMGTYDVEATLKFYGTND